MIRPVRFTVLYLTCGSVWCCLMQLFFVVSGAQQILADPARQSSKFLKVFLEYAPLPRIASDRMVLWTGFFVCGLFAVAAFSMVNGLLKGNWVRRGLTFGILHWLLMTPWFEFYLPYNVMHEPLPLVAFEALLWLATLLCTGLYMSFLLNFRAQPRHANGRARVIELPLADQ